MKKARKKQSAEQMTKATALHVAMAYGDLCKGIYEKLDELYNNHQMGADKAKVIQLMMDFYICSQVFRKDMNIFLGIDK